MDWLVLILLLDHNALRISAHPPVSMAPGGGGCAPVHLMAEILGPETEAWYCPRVEWIKPDGTVSSFEEDCPPFEERDEFRRIWSHDVCAPPNPDRWIVLIRLSKGGKMIAEGSISFIVK